MTLGERCDEILRLIDETLASLDPAPPPEPVLARAPSVDHPRPNRPGR